MDSVPCTACCIEALQTLLACGIAPVDSAVISVIQLQVEDGQLLSIMPSKLNIVGTMHALAVKALHRLQSRLEQVLHAQFAACRCTAELDWRMYMNSPCLDLINDAQVAKTAAKTASEVLGVDNVTAFVPMHGCMSLLVITTAISKKYQFALALLAPITHVRL